MLNWFAIAGGGAVGALLRFWISGGVYALLGRSFPYGTLAVNVIGSLLMGFLYVWFLERASLDPAWRAAILVGLLGAFTTFSTFALETFNLLEEGDYAKAVLNMLGSVLFCVLAVALGMWLARRM
ncbi:MAG: fluoride efflux transporter CrcB [Chromatiales bacterium]|nr:fluoride efflux transporter CrcB [Chromatiales bacterium]